MPTPALQTSTPWGSHAASTPTRSTVRLIGLEAREHTIRALVKKWFGPADTSFLPTREGELARRDAFLQVILRLNRIGCDLVPESQRTSLHEDDIYSVISVLNRLVLTGTRSLEPIAEFCERRAAAENNLRAQQLDPLQLRHLLSFSSEIPHDELNSADIHRLRSACIRDDEKDLRAWFEAMSAKQDRLPKETGQFLRRLTLDLWQESHRGSVQHLVVDAAVLDVALLDQVGWENSRLFNVIFKRLGGSACRASGAFLNAGEIARAADLYREIGDDDEVQHFKSLAQTSTKESLAKLERTIFAASARRTAHPKTVAIAAAPAPAPRKTESWFSACLSFVRIKSLRTA